MTELENKVIKPFMNDGGIKFYCWYVNDTLLVVKPQGVRRIHKLLIGSDINLKFTGDLFESEVPYFVAWKCHRMESRFSRRTLTLGYT